MSVRSKNQRKSEDLPESHPDQGVLRSEDSVQNGSALSEKLFQVIPAAIYTCDAEGRITSFNQTAEELWGRAPKIGDFDERFCGSFRLYWPDGRPLAHSQTPMATAIREGKHWQDTEVIIERPDGTFITVLVNISPIRDDGQQVTGAVNCFVDITERKRTEKLLTEQKSLLEVVASGRPLDECLSALCAAVSRLSSNLRIAILRVDDERRTLQRPIAPDLPDLFVEALTGAKISEFGRGGECVFGDRPVTVRDVAGEGAWTKEWRGVFVTHDVLAAHFTPVVAPSGLPVAWFMLCIHETRLPSDWELRIAQLGTHIASMALERDRSRRALASVTARLERQKRLYEAIISSTPDLVYVFDLNYRFTFVNDALLQMWGRSLEDSLGKSLLEIGYEPWHAEMHEREIDQVIATKQPVRGEVPFPHATLGRRIYDYILVPVLNASGEVEAVTGTTRDITDRKRIEDRDRFLVELNDAIRSLADPIEIQAGAAQVLGRSLRVSRAFYAEAEDDGVHIVVERSYVDGVPTVVGRFSLDDFGTWVVDEIRAGRTLVVEDVAELLSDGRLSESEQAAYQSVGVCAYVAVPLVKNGRLVAYLGLHQSERRAWTPDEIELVEETAERTWAAVEQARAEAALRESEERYQVLLEQSYDAIVVVDVNGIVTYASPSTQRVFGYTPDELLGRSAFEFVHVDDIEAAQAGLGEAIQFPESRVWVEIRIRHKDGSVVWIEVTGYNLLDHPRVQGIVSHFRDVTERRRAEVALRESERQLRAINETLEERVNERTAALLSYQDQLRSLAAQLSKAEEAERQRIAAGLHDNLAQMLAICKLKLSSLLKAHFATTDLPEARELSDFIDDALTYTRVLISDLAPPAVLETKELGATIAWLADRMKKHGLDVVIEDDEQPKPLDDEIRTTIIQSVRELLFNVVKHAGVSRVHVRLSRADDRLHISVEDRGRGFDASGAEARPTDDGGFGLFNIRERIDLLGGSFEISSGLGRGTKVTIQVPLQQEQEVLDPSRRVQGAPGIPTNNTALPPPPSGPKIRVLLVDDHEMMRRGLRTIIERQNDLVVIDEASDGLAAVKISRDKIPDVVVMDVSMPVMDGVDATRIIKSELPRVRVIGLSLHEEEDIAKAMRQAGASAYLTKGDAFETLCATIRSEAVTAGALP